MSYVYVFPFLSLQGSRGASGCSQRCPAGGHGGAAEENPDESKCVHHFCIISIEHPSWSQVTPPLFWFFPQHDESSRRHMEQIEQRKEKAAELSSGRHANTDYAPKLTPYERKKQCSLCAVVVGSSPSRYPRGLLNQPVSLICFYRFKNNP